MGIFDFFKKTEAQKTTEETKGDACLGVLGFFPMKEKRELLIAATLEGSLTVGDRLQFCNPDQGMDTLETVVVKKLTCQNKDVESLRDEELVYLEIDMLPSLAKLKKGSVLYSPGVDEKKRLSSYAYALYRAFVTIQEGKVSDEDYQNLSLDDSIEILQAFLWDCRQKPKSEESNQENTRKSERLAEIVKDKLLEADSIYAVYSENTGEPYLFSTTYDRGDEGYLCTDPMIMLFTPRWYHQYKETIENQLKVVKRIENTEDKKGIENFLGTAFYLIIKIRQLLKLMKMSTALILKHFH